VATRAFIALGSNLAHPRRQIAAALDALRRTHGIRVLAVSPNYVSAPVGGPQQPDYVNAVAEIETTLSPRALLAQTVPGRGLARRFLPAGRPQRIARTRKHHR
jgi:2-amino-4-hydroxy-6-hydroxymethyldihydropteridine diphosphokinase